MSAASLVAIVTPIAIIAAAVLAWAGNYQVQRRMHDQLRLRQGVDDLKRRLHEFIDLSAPLLDPGRPAEGEAPDARSTDDRQEADHSGGIQRDWEQEQALEEVIPTNDK